MFSPLSINKHFIELCHWVTNSCKSDKTLVTSIEATVVTGCTVLLKSCCSWVFFPCQVHSTIQV